MSCPVARRNDEPSLRGGTTKQSSRHCEAKRGISSNLNNLSSHRRHFAYIIPHYLIFYYWACCLNEVEMGFLFMATEVVLLELLRGEFLWKSVSSASSAFFWDSPLGERLPSQSTKQSPAKVKHYFKKQTFILYDFASLLRFCPEIKYPVTILPVYFVQFVLPVRKEMDTFAGWLLWSPL